MNLTEYNVLVNKTKDKHGHLQRQHRYLETQNDQTETPGSL